jgi:hypothetical protein
MKNTKYNEGQWFAVPLNDNLFALGIIVRGSYMTKGGLGYFFGPKLDHLPTEEEVRTKTPEQAILISWFSDLGIVQGRWPLVIRDPDFDRAIWPIPRFGRKNALLKGRASIVEYGETVSGKFSIVRETPVEENVIDNLPEDGYRGGGNIERKLINLLDAS